MSTPDNSRPMNQANGAALTMWLQVLSRPKLYDRMGRKPSREHMLLLIDYYLPVARAYDERTTVAASRLRELFEAWAGPGLSPEIVAASRALHIAEGFAGSEWTFDEEPDDEMVETFETGVIWPEQVAERLKGERPRNG